MHAGFATAPRSVSARPRSDRRVVTRASQDDSARPGGSASSPNRRANHQSRASSPVRERSVSSGTGALVPSAGARGDAHAKPPRLASVRNAAWSSVAAGVSYGDRRARLSRAQLRAGLRARKALKKRGEIVAPSASRKGGVFARDGVSFYFPEDRFTFARRAWMSDDVFLRALDEEDASFVEYRDASGEPFTVNLTNVGAPPGLTAVTLKGMDRANLLGALCTALAKANVSVVSGSISTNRRTKRVLNTMYVCDRETGKELDPSVFENVSVRVLSACWTADERAWLAPPRSVGRFIVDDGRRRENKRGSLFGGFFEGGSSDTPNGDDKEFTRLTNELDLAEAKTRACSARLADAVERADSYDTGFDLDGSLRNLLADVETAAGESFAARNALEAHTRLSRGSVAGFEAAPRLGLDDQSVASTEERLEELLDKELLSREGFKGGASDAERATNRKTTASSPSSVVRDDNSDASSFGVVRPSNEDSLSQSAKEDQSAFGFNALKTNVSDAYDGVSPFVKGVFFMNVASCLFGTNQVVIKQVADAGVDDFTQMFLRFAVAAVPLVPFIYRGAKSSNRVELLKGATHLGTILAVGYFLQIIGLEGTTSAKGALTSTFTVLSVPVFAALAGQKVPWFTWPASLVAVAGVGLLTGGDGSEFVAGDAVCILSAVIFGYHTLTSSKYARLFEDQELPFISLQIGVVAAESGLWKLSEMWYRGGTDLTSFVSHSVDVASGLPWPALLWMGLATTSFTLWIEFLALKNVSASTCALIYTAEPLWGALFAWHFMGDRWGAAGWLGATLVVGASVGSQLLSTIEEAADSAEGDSNKGGGNRGEDREDMYTENFSRY